MESHPLSENTTPSDKSLPTPPPPNNSRKQRRPKALASDPTRQKASSTSHAINDRPHPALAPNPRAPAVPSYPPYPIMNPPYPLNGSAFTQGHSASPYNPSAGTSSNRPSPQVGPGVPNHHVPPHPYPYAIQHNPYAGPPTYNYPQYQHPMMIYPRPAATESLQSQGQSQGTPSPVPSPASASASGKRKRKPGDEPRSNSAGERASDEETASGRNSASKQSVVDIKKRTKTQRACDSCRTRKIRCDWTHTTDRCDIIQDSDPPICQHCKQYGYECTSFKPITETRFKKRKLEQEAAASGGDKERGDGSQRATASPSPGSGHFFGPTSPAHLLHSAHSIPSRLYESYDMRYNHTWEVRESGDGLIQVAEPHHDEPHLAMPKPIDPRIERDVIQKLVNAYFSDVAPLLPVVTQAELLSNSSPPPILLYSMCAVAAARREVPQTVFDALRYAANNVIKMEDVLSSASIVNVQSLLILCMTGDCHSQFVPNALSALWIRLGTAVRMAQDLGLHRAESVKQNIEMRRRLWGACVISDRWTSLAYGHPFMIDVQDCDARLPSSGDPHDLYMDEMVRLSIILGRVLKTIYSPSGLTLATDEVLEALLADIEAWKDNLPESLRFHGNDTPRNAGVLHLLYSCVCMIFWRVFMRISYSCPTHLKFSLTVEQWTKLVKLTGEAIDWLDGHERLYDVWLLVAYATTSCALVQYHTWARRKDPEAAAKLRKLRDCVRRWEKSLSPDHMSARRKTAEIISLLYEATQGPAQLEAPPLNPTGGVKGKQLFEGLNYKKDPSRPGGGVYVAQGKARAGDYSELPPGSVVYSDEESEGEGSSSGLEVSHVRTASSHDNTRLSSSSSLPPAPSDAPGVSSHWPGTNPAAGARPQNDVTTRIGQGGRPSGGPSAPASSSMVNIVPLSGSNTGVGGVAGGNFPNLNPAMNDLMSAPRGSNVHVMNVLDMPMPDSSSGALEQFALQDDGFLEGLPGGMFDWGQWDTFFARLAPQVGLPGFQQPAAQADHHQVMYNGNVHSNSAQGNHQQQNENEMGQLGYPPSS
ncbi:hypothetical protein JAAARDRAFT_31927 [Jaapia argillacea MUCL 33604]|uniref:Zn(2)-C6 fungal-type domain-containing protein n=1 Tax=Jaapia argillacea MUCL 33604 TaxID=933084 RepID=A0A067QED5_9AGAM|nr:hypothetical protein JAAARDRAFT_31927 [Jaapia argillacea MUCL 33604]